MATDRKIERPNMMRFYKVPDIAMRATSQNFRSQDCWAPTSMVGDASLL
jgi:hypothetical protein